ncbi:hypothetical protein M5E84_10795 [[Ruminococcus] torques]|nr:hypothetical protein M5E84_10795 [[Ruminococcus] torques]
MREKRKKTDRFIREEADKEERKIQKMLQECEYLEQDMDEIQREYEERKQEWELLEKTIKNQEKEKESDFNKRSDEGTKESRSKYFIAAGLGGLFTGAAGLLWSRFMAEQSAVPSAPFAWIGVFAFVIGVCALAAGGYEAGKKSGKRKKEDPVMCLIIIPIKTTRERRNKNSSWSGRWSICVWNGRKKSCVVKMCGSNVEM